MVGAKSVLGINHTWLQPHRRSITYIQGQFTENVREYFYYVDHQGMLFQDDSKMKNFTSCIKDKQFLRFFFKRLKRNDLLRYEHEFPYISPCGKKEINFVRCFDHPIVYTHVIRGSSGESLLSHNQADRLLTTEFQPAEVAMDPNTGRVYHPASEKCGSVGLIADKLSILWTQEKRFIFGNSEEQPPTQFVWDGKEIELSNRLLKSVSCN
eukprot:TCALIF_08462-PB protein Name:"Similar to C8orf82 UPF0598 protein C8orf82 (Homo sapiens)" AED:0.32 eAED:0.45 QI:0/0.75/0.6/1/0.25/0.2/5/75/209